MKVANAQWLPTLNLAFKEMNMNMNKDIAALSEPFMEFANTQTFFGYLKAWKATSIMCTIAQMEDEMKGERLNKYIHNCLEMEGFLPGACDDIADWIETKIGELTL